MTDMNMSDASSQGSSTTSGIKDAAGQTYQEVRTKALDAVSRTTVPETMLPLEPSMAWWKCSP